MVDIANNKHHHIQSFVVGRYITANISRLDRAAIDNKRILCRIVDIAGSKEQPRYKLRCLYGLLKGLHPTSALAAVSTAIQKSQGSSISINKAGNEIALAHVASQASTSNKVGVSCNCKKGCGTRRCRCYKNDLKCSVYCHNTDYDCKNLKPLAERTEISFMPRESWGVLDCSEGNASEGDQSTGETQAPMPVVVQNQQIWTRRQRKELERTGN